MATNKNQHFVPRCYLKPFTANGENAAINLYNIDRNRLIRGAPVKNQCSRDYFYGQDPQLEEAIQSVESAYGSVLREILTHGCSLTKGHCWVLRVFWMLQNVRTEAASKRSVEMADEALDGIDPSFRFEIKEAVQSAMHAFAALMEVVSDLKVCLIKNTTDVPFITSDDPAILTNRWYLESNKTKGMSFGMRDAGALLLLPLSPKIYCICYDSDVYSIASEKGWVIARHKSDIEALNEFQLLHCRANLFLAGDEYAAGLDAFVRKHQGRRPLSRHLITYAVFDGIENGQHKKYRVVDKEDFNNYADGMMHCQTVHPRPTAWPGFLLRKNNGVAYYNGTAVGYLRSVHAEAGAERPFRKIPAYG